jgi:hypothetical protein
VGFLDNIVNVAIAAGTGYVTGGPTGAFIGAASADQAQRKAKQQKQRQIEAQRQQKEYNNMIRSQQDAQFGDFYTPPANQSRTTNAGFGSGFGTFLSDVGSNIVNPLAGIFSQVRPFISQQSAGQPALPTRSNLGGQESQQSGTNQAFMGGFGNVLGQAGRLLRTPGGQIGTGLLGGLGASMLSGGGGGMRITRKMKSQYRAVLNLAQGDYDAAANMIGVSTDMFIMVLLKRFRNDGPVVTKAALRKTKTTVRRLKSMCDMYDSLRPSATRRKAPMRRAATTLISNK